MENIQNEMKKLFGGSCYGYCLAYLFGDYRDIKALTQAFMQGWVDGFIDYDGFVTNPLGFIHSISIIMLIILFFMVVLPT